VAVENELLENAIVYVIFVLTWLVATFCMGMFGFAILPDDIPGN